MEKLHKPEYRSWISDRMNVREFRDKWASVKLVVDSYVDYSLFHEHSISKDQVDEELEDIDPISLLDEVDAKYSEKDAATIPDCVDLKTLNIHALELQQRQEPRYKNFVVMSWRNWCIPGEPVKEVEDESSPKVSFPEVVLCVQFLRPEEFNYRKENVHPTRTAAFSLDQEYSVLGCQSLSDLRNKVFCVSDSFTPGDFSLDPNEQSSITCKDLFKSGCFYIDGVFYNDHSSPDNINYSKVIIDWASCAKDIGPFTEDSMDKLFCDLNLRLGYPYLYLHQGNCEHLMLIYDMRILKSHDTASISKYPIQKQFKCHSKRKVACMTCHKFTAQWIITKNKLLPEKAYFMCHACHLAFNYNSKGKKSDFEAYKYVDRTCYP